MKATLATWNRRWPSAILALLALVAFVACAGPTMPAGPDVPQTTLNPGSDFADEIQGLLILIVALAVVVTVVVQGALIWAIFRYRRRPSDPMPRQVHGNTPLEIAWTIAPALILVAIAIPTASTIFYTQGEPPASMHAMQIKAIGHQWWWEFQYADQPLTPGGIVTANELHVLRGQTVRMDLETADVLHSFWIPKFAGTRDMVPNHPNHIWFTPNVVGDFPGQCKQFCGDSHANMRLWAVSQERADFDNWVKQQQAKPGPPAADVARGAEIFAKGSWPAGACSACHTIEGVSQGVIGPNLTHVGSRSYIAAGVLKNTPENLRAWLNDPPSIKPGSIMPKLGLSKDEIDALVPYLLSLK